MSKEEIKDDYRYKAEQLAEMYFDAYAKAPNAKRRTALSRSYQEAMRALADYTVIRLKLARGKAGEGMSAFINEPLPRGNDGGPELVIVNPAPVRVETAAAENIAAQIRQQLDIDITGDELLALLRRFLDDAGHDE